MVDRRKKLLNLTESTTANLIEKAAKKYDAQVAYKVRVADVLEISGSGISNEEYSYALSAHFDFILYRDNMPDFAIEYDGKQHQLDDDTKRRDALKQSICEQLSFPLVRIDSRYLRKLSGYYVISWLVEMWYLNEEFETEQQEGNISLDEPFTYFSFFEPGYIEDGEFVSIDRTTTDVIELINEGKIITHRPFFPFASTDSRGIHEKMKGEIIGHERGLGFSDNQVIGFSVIQISSDSFLYSEAQCNFVNFWAVPPAELSMDFADYDIWLQYKQFKDQELNVLTRQELYELLEKFDKHTCSLCKEIN